VNIDSPLFPAGSVHPVLGWFRSIGVFPASGEDGHLKPDIELLCGWIERLDRWYTLAIGDRLDLLYGRELTVSDYVSGSNAEYLARLALTCEMCGMDCVLTIDLDDVVDPDIDRLFEIVPYRALSTLVVVVPSVRIVTEWTEHRRERWRQRLERFLATGVLVEFVCTASPR
jgi:hypothetical protein